MGIPAREPDQSSAVALTQALELEQAGRTFDVLRDTVHVTEQVIDVVRSGVVNGNCQKHGSKRSHRRAIAEVDHAADAVLRLHQLESSVDLVERERVRDEGVDVDVSVEVALNKLWHLVAALDAAE